MEEFDMTMLGVIVPQAVGVLMMIAALVAALVMRGRLGVAATGLTVAATALGALTFVFNAWWQSAGVRMVFEGGGDGRYTVLTVVSLATWAMHLLWTGLLIAAVFAGRRRTPVVQNVVLGPGSLL
ncbi:hypothetical protein [Catellatospora citrea]|uniref:Uncharacterized protein n=1 Tax=Catellatospora citrea TaxID=53366 RepID=A0A8J3KT23_9ACTN|nr:hypothetical protein [Catellatospora citrea]GIG00735.1 hypothetical protein Cci01nite_58280 [Catellatospora citrea]